MTLEVTEAECAANATAPRVSLASMEAKIKAEYTTTLDKAYKDCPTMDHMKVMTLHTIVMKNDFILIGKSAPASPANFNTELGAKLAREDAIRQLWQLEGYALREDLARAHHG